MIPLPELLQDKKGILVFANAGPLHTLAVLDQLDVLSKLEVDMYMVDAVSYGLDPFRNRTDENVRDFIIYCGVRLFPTSAGYRMLSQMFQDKSTKGKSFRELATIEVLVGGRLDRYAKNAPCIVLFRDTGEIQNFAPNIYLVPTFSFFRGLEDSGFLDSAGEMA